MIPTLLCAILSGEKKQMRIWGRDVLMVDICFRFWTLARSGLDARQGSPITISDAFSV